MRKKLGVLAGTAVLAGAGLAFPASAQADTPPPCTAPAGHHCLAVTNYTSQDVSVEVDLTSNVQQIACVPLPAKRRKYLPYVYLPNGSGTISVEVFTGLGDPDHVGDSCYADNRGNKSELEYAILSVDQQWTYEYIDIH